MKLCPNCKTNYSDDTLRFCLSDGAKLVPMSAGGEKTLELTGNTNPIRFDVPNPSEPTIVSPVNPINQTIRRGISPWLIIPLFAILLFAIIGLVGYILLKPNEIAVSNQPIPTPAPTAAPNDETNTIKEELESLKKQIAERNTAKNNSNARPFPNQNPNAPIVQLARVNSPNDGFLALRSIPDSTNGIMLAKIPHGTNIEIIGCQKNAVQLPGKRRGRWCRTNYNEYSGWVFDAFLSY